MNLMVLANSATQAINPNVVGTFRSSNGYSTDAAGYRTPAYVDFPDMIFQIQAVSGIGTDGPSLQHLNALNIQGTLRSAWMTGNAEALNRVTNKGGDLLVLPTTTLSPAGVYLVVQMVESWDVSGWCHFIIQLQKDAPS